MSDKAEKQLRFIKTKQGGIPGNEAEMELVLLLIFQVCPTTYNLLFFFLFLVFCHLVGEGLGFGSYNEYLTSSTLYMNMKHLNI